MSVTIIPLVDKANKADIVAEYKEVKDNAVLRNVIYQLCLQVVLGKAQTDVVNSVLLELIKNNNILVNIVCDVLAVLDIESTILENRPNFIQLLLAVANRTVAVWMLKERLDYSTLAEVEIIPNEKQAATKLIKLKTKLFYKQQKFNLLREESEGYSKLVTELAQVELFDHVYLLNSIKSLIGCFNLDPNRVLDIILECFETRLQHKDLFIPLIKSFLDNPHTLNQIIAFKFRFYGIEGVSPNVEPIPRALFDVTAHIINSRLITVDQLYPYLAPTDSAILKEHQEYIEEGTNYNKKIVEFLSVEGAKLESLNFYEDEKSRVIGTNQKLGLVHSLLKLGDWKNVLAITRHMPEHYVASFPALGKALCKHIHYLIDPFYRANACLPQVLSSRIRPYRRKHQFYDKQIESVEQFKATIIPMLFELGPYLYRDTLLITKIARICRSLFASLRFETINLLNITILPAFSLVESNSPLAEELWALLSLFPYNERYLLYYHWRLGLRNPANPMLVKMKSINMRKIKYIMKRISKDKDAIKQSGRIIGKLCHSNPTLMFGYILSQIQSYDNLIAPVVDCLKFLSSLSYDVIMYCIIEALSNPAKEETKHEGNTISSWMLCLANFSGSVVRKYPVELPGLLQFIANQLKVNKSLDLLILKEIVQKMTGIEISEEMTDEQLEAMSGGELLRSEGGSYNAARNIRRSTQRLKDALVENNLAMPLCILMAQQRNCIVFESEHTHLKLIGKLYDQTQDTLVQYGNFLSNSLTIDDYKRRLPSLKELLTDYHLPADAAFFLYRPKVSHDINSVFENLTANENEKETPDKTSTKSAELKLFNRATETIIMPLVESVLPILSGADWADLSPKLYMAFWTLAMYDIQVPEQSYLREKAKLHKQIQDMEEQKEMPVSKKRKERERLQNIMNRLTQELNQQKDHCERIMHRLGSEKAEWFDANGNKVDMITRFLQYCLFPRCRFTASDALFCARFVHLLHSLKTPHFSTLICFDRIFGDISYTMCSCSENEANNYGRFLCSIMSMQTRWHKDIQFFKTECDKFPGFVTKYSEKDPVHIDYESYRHVCHKWHYRLTKAFILCLDSGDYIQIRNSLIVLTKMLPYYPVMISFASAIERRLEKIRLEEKEKRPDLFVLATGYCGQLKLKKNTFIQESQFHIKEIKNRMVAANAARSGSATNSPGEGAAQQQPQQQSSKVKEEGEEDASPTKKEKRAEPKTTTTEAAESKSRAKPNSNNTGGDGTSKSSSHAGSGGGGSSRSLEIVNSVSSSGGTSAPAVETDKKKEFRLKKSDDARPSSSQSTSGGASASTPHGKDSMTAPPPPPVVESRISTSASQEKRSRDRDDDGTSSQGRVSSSVDRNGGSSSSSSHDRAKRETRKRPGKSVIMESPESKKKREDDSSASKTSSSSRRSDDRDSRKASESSSKRVSRRHKEDA